MNWNKKTMVVYLALAVLVVTAFLLASKISLFKQFLGQQESPRPAVSVAEYSAEGEVVDFQGRVTTLKIGIVGTGGENGRINYENRTVTLGASVLVTKIKLENGNVVKQPGSVADIKIGSKIVVYSSQNIVEVDSLTVDRVDILLF